LEDSAVSCCAVSVCQATPKVYPLLLLLLLVYLLLQTAEQQQGWPHVIWWCPWMVSVTLKTSSGSISALMVSSSVTSSFTGNARNTLHPQPDRHSVPCTQALISDRHSPALALMSICGSSYFRKKASTTMHTQSEEHDCINANIQ